MSDQIPPGAVPGGEPSEEELRAAIGQMRAAPVEQMIAEVLTALLNAAQMKLGRNDARLLLDLAAIVAEGTRGQVDADLTRQVDEALGQLRMAQVQGEQEVVQAATQGQAEPNDLPRRPAPLALAERPASTTDEDDQGDGDAPAPAAQQPPPGSAASRLWVPGR